MGLVGDGIQNIWFSCKGVHALERLRFVLKYDVEDFSDMLTFGGLLTRNGKFKMNALLGELRWTLKIERFIAQNRRMNAGFAL